MNFASPIKESSKKDEGVPDPSLEEATKVSSHECSATHGLHVSIDIADIFLPCTQDDLDYWTSILEHNQATISLGVISRQSRPKDLSEIPLSRDQ